MSATAGGRRWVMPVAWTVGILAGCYLAVGMAAFDLGEPRWRLPPRLFAVYNDIKLKRYAQADFDAWDAERHERYKIDNLELISLLADHRSGTRRLPGAFTVRWLRDQDHVAGSMQSDSAWHRWYGWLNLLADPDSLPAPRPAP